MTAVSLLSRWLISAVLLVVSSSGSARDLNQDEALKLRQEGRILPLEQLLQTALQRYPGAVLLEAELEDEDGRLVYEVELVTSQGVVREIELNAGSGEVIKDEVDD
ncbi:PepSY domain-containing protein [Pseudomonas sp. 5P_3.1_Bac2]|uniref:PepSY domain-containing protein n=1 Tax=Pseudomonas sp. 5P_3.1_Bac2 TaxID=2971617 RepID=UPI0021C7A9EE|nr:PepSY domain-containing protein [Pseudomonas sp. 5P_3.1_Bac2]MCU1717019.1 PepSY domain-containing protein [Pseudomonas sp. 5P_3.1_Bac2]